MTAPRAVQRRRSAVPGRLGRLLRVAAATLVVTAAGGVVLAAGVVLFRHLDAPLRVIAVDGEIRHLGRAEIEGLVSRHLDGGFLTLDMQALRDELESHPWIAAASARREWPDGLYLHLVEEAPVARWGEDQFLNGRGQVLPGVAADDFTDLPQLIGPEGRQAELMADYRRFAERLAPEGLRIQRLVHADAGVRLHLAGGIELVLGRAQIDARLGRFLVVWRGALMARRGALAYADARYDNGVAVRWRPAPAAQDT
ncbi:MAG: cell division protein FtsQ/DivIB [Pseudomonadota bacterium]